jgi:hypothetical protein
VIVYPPIPTINQPTIPFSQYCSESDQLDNSSSLLASSKHSYTNDNEIVVTEDQQNIRTKNTATKTINLLLLGDNKITERKESGKWHANILPTSPTVVQRS